MPKAKVQGSKLWKTSAPKRVKTPYKRKNDYTGKELKFMDVATAANVIAGGGEIHLDSMCEVDQGTGEEQRIGRKIIIRSIGIHLNVQLPATTSSAASTDSLRFIVYQDKQANGAIATVAGILEDSNIFAFNNLSNKNRFRILCDKIWNVNAAAAGGNATNNLQTGEFVLHKTWFKSALNIPVEYSGTGNAIADITSNNIGILALSENSAVTLETNTRIRFTDS